MKVRINIYGVIGDSFFEDGITERAIAAQLEALEPSVTTIEVHINSTGGDAFAGIAIANLLREQVSKGRSVEVTVDGLAASAASVIMCGGSRIRIAHNALLLIHGAWTYTVGDAGDHRKIAESLDKLDAAIVATYRLHSPLDAEAIAALVKAETWMNADEALAKGFVHEVLSAEQDDDEGELGAMAIAAQAHARLMRSAGDSTVTARGRGR